MGGEGGVGEGRDGAVMAARARAVETTAAATVTAGVGNIPLLIPPPAGAAAAAADGSAHTASALPTIAEERLVWTEGMYHRRFSLKAREGPGSDDAALVAAEALDPRKGYLTSEGELGSGSFGAVYKARCNKTGRVYAFEGWPRGEH